MSPYSVTMPQWVNEPILFKKMNQSDFNYEILRNTGGKSRNNLYEILTNFTGTDFEIDKLSDSPYIDIDSLSEQLIAHTKKFSVLSVNIQSMNVKFDKYS